ncbi:phosphotransferase [Paenibacillus sp. sptzw28]|uniref:phosphotransferase enzyme family protein n=1 Tax=Paenibacillus sp. sptzw28 TaxID=715179 RepID=UPI001C6EA783|nr:phosphotransferase [Paenibacillus sp. sptzw28]QYR23514.1 phosphotransferase [Paenibacillus sp. sptzw28]
MESLFRELISKYFGDLDYSTEPVPFGLTNFSRIITVKDRKYIARIYDRHTKNLENLLFEIELVTFLENCDLSFKVPGFLPTRSGHKYVELQGNRLGSVVPFIEGVIPDINSSNDVKEMGRTVGEISKAFEEFQTDLHTPAIQFSRFYDLHPLSSEETVAQFLLNPPFVVDDSHMALFRNLLDQFQPEHILLSHLPHQIVHHDLLIFNLLIGNNGKMNGVLDFDFASIDIRAFEPAICINHLLQFEDRTLDYLEIFLKAYSAYMKLSMAEIDMIPNLIRLYYLSLLCIYIGQYYSGKAVKDHFTFIIAQMSARDYWLKENKDNLKQTLIHLVY